MSMKLIKPGLYTTVQDLGRYGYQKYGVIVSGAMDSFALRVANLLVDNPENESGLEITLAGPTIEWQENTWIAICGADFTPMMDGEKVPGWRPIYVEKGSILTFHNAIQGCRVYLAVAGGIHVPTVMDSRSTYLRGKIGGLYGRPLLKGDELQFGRKSDILSKRFLAVPWFISSELLPRYGLNSRIRIIKGTEWELFTEESRQAILSESYTIDPQSDRMGYKLKGIRKHLRHPLDMISEAVTAGTIQVPPEGDPIVLLADRQTTGGYPRIAQIAAVDLPVVAQMKPGDKLRFVEITHKDAEKLYLERECDINKLKQGIRLKWKG